MKASELRIGNWVNIDFYRQIELTDFDDYFGGWKNGENDKVEPIPLTTEVLEAAGFYIEDGCYHSPHNYSITLHYNDQLGDFRYNRIDGGATSIEHLHQLQNWHFALIGTELQVNI